MNKGLIRKLFGSIALCSSVFIAWLIFSRPGGFDPSSVFDWYFISVACLFLVASVLLLKR